MYVSKFFFAPLAGLEMSVMYVFLLFSVIFFIVYRYPDFEISCSNGTKTSHVSLVAGGP
jgi:hypothetical protein